MQYNFIFENPDNDPELDKLLDKCAEAYNNLMIYVIKKDLGLDLKIIDDTHVSIDGEVMDEYEFQDWLDLNYPEQEEDFEDDPNHYDA